MFPLQAISLPASHTLCILTRSTTPVCAKADAVREEPPVTEASLLPLAAVLDPACFSRKQNWFLRTEALRPTFLKS
jgi:hypothetical protein